MYAAAIEEEVFNTDLTFWNERGLKSARYGLVLEKIFVSLLNPQISGCLIKADWSIVVPLRGGPLTKIRPGWQDFVYIESNLLFEAPKDKKRYFRYNRKPLKGKRNLKTRFR